MCKFCEENVPMARSLEGFPYPLLEIARRKLDGKYVMLLATVKDDRVPKMEIEISVCPKCGRKLNRRNNGLERRKKKEI